MVEQLTLLQCVEIIRNRKPADVTADEVAAIRARVEASPITFSIVGGAEAVERFLAHAEAALAAQAAQPQADEIDSTQPPPDSVPRTPISFRRKVEFAVYAMLLLGAAGWIYILVRPSEPAGKPMDVAKTPDQKTPDYKATKAAPKSPQPKRPAAASPDKPATEPPTEDLNDPNLWQGWQIVRSKGGTAEKKRDWDLTDPGNPIPAIALFVTGGPLQLKRSVDIGADDKWLLLLARPVTPVFPGGHIVVTLDGKEAAKASIGSGESDWPLYVPLPESQQAQRQLEITFLPGTAQQQISLWSARLVTSQPLKPVPESPLIAALRSPDPAARAKGAAAAAQVNDPLVVGSLVRALKDRDVEVRLAAVAALARYNDLSRPFVVAGLIEKLRDADPEVARLAAQVLMAFDTEATWVALSATMTTHPDLPLRLQIAGQLSGRPLPVVRAAFAKLMDSKEDPLRLAAVNSLANSNDPAGAALLLRALNDSNRDVRQAALLSLARYGAVAPSPQVVEALIAKLRGTDPVFRRLAAQTLMAFDTDPTWVALSQSMSADPDAQLRLQIAQQLAGRKHPAVRAAFGKLLDDVDDSLRLTAVNSVAGSPDAAVVPLLVRALADPEPGVRRAAATALVSRREETAETALIAALTSHPDAMVRRIAITRFHKFITPRAVPAICSVVNGPDNLLRRLVPQALARLTGDEADAALVKLFNWPDYNVRLATAEVLSNRPGPVAEELMFKAITGDNVTLRQFALRRFTQPALVTPRVIPALREAMKSPSATVRFEVLEATRNVRLAQLRRSNFAVLAAPPWNETLALMAQGIDDPVARVRVGAAGVLRGDPHPDADAFMPRLMASQDLQVRQLAAGRYPGYARTSVKNLEFHKLCLKDSDPLVRACAVVALATIPTPESKLLVDSAIDDPAFAVRHAVQTFRRGDPNKVSDEALLPAAAITGMPQAVPLLVKLLSDPKPSVRQAAIQRLCQNLDPAADAAIQQACRTHPDLVVRRVAAQYLFRKPAPPGGIEIVRELIRDPDPELRETAANLLLRTPTPEGIAMVAPLLKDPIASVRMTAATLLSVTPLPAADDVVIPLLSNPDWQIRQLAVQRFARTPNPRAAAGLIDAAGAPEFEIRQEAMGPLNLMKDLAVFAFLARTLNDPNESHSMMAAEMLRARTEPECVAPMLAALATHPSINVRAIAALKFEAQPNPAALGPLVALAKHEDDGVRFAAIRALGKMTEPTAAAALVAALADPIPEVKMTAAAALAARRDDGAEAAMIAALAAPGDVEVRRLAATRFQQIPTPKAVPALAAAVKDVDDQLRLLAVQALQHTPTEGMDLLIAALNDPSETIRQAALAALAPQPDPRAKGAVAAFKARTQPAP
ncbi:MAG: HEAT repeat domain-containing protein [Planctomycetia bacterium]|nr:HEAT repeat domain-containing protein [Planctomycetia bacterium]